jgi:glycosyltransferase involved in cell wall biosynthesis
MSEKTAFVGNMNNMPYMFSKEMRKKKKSDVTLYVDAPPEFKLDRPEAYDKTISYPFPSWIKEIPPGSANFHKLRLPQIFLGKFIEDLNGYDIVVLNGMWIALAPYLDEKVKIYSLCAGYDIDTLADLQSVEKIVKAALEKKTLLRPFKFLLSAYYKRAIRQQREGIKRSEGINYYPTGISKRGDEIIREIKGGKKYERLELRGFPVEDFPYSEVDVDKENFTILNFTRFFFLNEDRENKRNDIMLEGIGLFLKEIDFNENVEIILFQKGDVPSLAKAKEIVERLGYSKLVTWLGEVSQEQLFNEIVPSCDVAFDQLGSQWIGAGAFVMAMGRPIIANGRPEIFEPLTGEKSPVCQATNSEEVCFWLKKLYFDRKEINRIGLESRTYIEKYYSIENTINFFS